ncbi:MAG: phage terminase small subunit P27 family [Tepidisphaeraceae bacterium]
MLKARGTFRADRHHDSAKATGKPTCPSWLTDKDARAEFRRLVRLLSEMGLIGAADTNVIVRYCLAWVRWRRVAQTLAANAGAEVAVYKDADGKPKAVQVSALHSIARSLSDELSRAEAVLGLSPSARSRLSVATTPPPASPLPESKSRFFMN